MGSGEVAIVALSTMISLKVPFSDGLGGGKQEKITFLIKNLSKYLVVSQKVTTFATAIQK